jgi:hypothetical protein
MVVLDGCEGRCKGIILAKEMKHEYSHALPGL